ncbi:hypothetical protein RQP46_006205 [Phenoliferia psychrophenolica]
MAPLQSPPELVVYIIELTVELLIEEERRLEAHASLSNEFLLSAALGSRTWHSIATPVLLKRGIVTSGSVVAFLARIKAYEMEATLTSVRFGEASGGVTPERAPEEDKAFNLLVESLSELKSIEIIESGSHFQTALPPGRSIQQVHLSNFPFLDGGFGRKFKDSPPTHLIVTETRPLSSFTAGPNRDTPFSAFKESLVRVDKITITTADESSLLFYFGLLRLLGDQTQSRLQTCHFECKSLDSFSQLSIYPRLEHLTSHLVAAHFLLALGSQPSLATLEVLADIPGVHYSSKIIAPSPNIALLELIHALPVLENLKVPASWASDAVREACDAKGVVLLSS